MADTTHIEAILAKLPADQRAALQDFRETTAKVALDAAESDER